MANELFVPQGERETLGLVKETSFGVFPGATGMMWHSFKAFDPKLTDTPIARVPRGSLFSPVPATGGRSGDASLDIEGDVDTLGQIMAWAMGSQSTPSLNVVATTLSAVAAAAATSITVASSTNIFPRMVITVAGNTPVAVTTVAGTTVNLAAGLSVGAASGAAVTCTSTTAYASTIIGGSPLPTFSIQRNTPGAGSSSFLCRDYLACKIDSMALAIAAKTGLAPKLNILYRNEVIDGAPITAALSTKNPVVFEQQGSAPILGATAIGVGTEASVISVSLSISNNLLKDYFSLGDGNLVRAFPEQMRKVTGTMVLDFASTSLYNDFLAITANGSKVLVQLTVPLAGTDSADSTLAIPYAFTLVVPQCYLSVYNGAAKSSGVLQQTVTFEGSESSAGANDALKVYHIGTSATIY